MAPWGWLEKSCCTPVTVGSCYLPSCLAWKDQGKTRCTTKPRVINLLFIGLKSSQGFVSGVGAIMALFFLLAGGALQAPACGSWL